MYEYLVFDVDDDEDSQEITDQLNDLAAEGWRVVSCVRASELINMKPGSRKNNREKNMEVLWRLRFILERSKT